MDQSDEFDILADVKDLSNLLKESMPPEHIYVRCAELIFENTSLSMHVENHQAAFEKLQKAFREQQVLFHKRFDGLQKAHEQHIVEVTQKYKEVVCDAVRDTGNLHTDERNKFIEEYVVNTVKPQFEVDINKAHAAGFKDARSALAKHAAHQSHIEDYKIKALAFDWFASNIQNYRGKLNDCAEAFAKIEPIKFSTARAWLRDWRKAQKAKPKL
jgi:hypothetical protein